MRWLIVSVAAVALSISALAQQSPVELKSLVGRKAIAQRMPLYEPGTYNMIPKTYGGKEVTIIGFKPLAMPKFTLSPAALARLTPEQRASIEDAQGMGTLTVQFADGTKADTGPIMPSLLTNYLEVIAEPSATPSPSGDRPTEATATSASSSPPANPEDTLSPDEVKRAAEGSGRDHWVKLTDYRGSLYGSIVYGSDHKAQNPTVSIYMPEAILATQGEIARRQFLKYAPSVEDTRRSITVIAEGLAGGTTTGPDCTSITRVVLLSDPSGKVVEEAYLSEPLEESWRNGFGVTSVCQAMRAKFSMESVRKVKAAATDGEFLVAVFSGTVNTKMYTVKRKHQTKLGLQ
jgi:hypothetical protein